MARSEDRGNRDRRRPRRARADGGGGLGSVLDRGGGDRGRSCRTCRARGVARPPHGQHRSDDRHQA
ncbi:hypothetical protein E4K65_33960 [Bradyrhizobium niftali]|uniref:Uncharacterized protein n=1 Tax=Bradyrhizobium niftali TaxID=2560055 RepID=A0A4Y9LKN1_9BRAD|nr:hypothetical protein E4K65_33960 [Bradyrhizobium niftali]